VSRADVIRLAYTRYHAGEITLAELVRTVVQWRR
jgi:hypothetical protein